MQANKETMVASSQQQIEARRKKEKKAEGKQEEAKKRTNTDLKFKKDKVDDKRDAILAKVTEERHQNYLMQRETMKELDKKHKEKKDRAATEYELKKARDYKKDLEYHELLTNK